MKFVTTWLAIAFLLSASSSLTRRHGAEAHCETSKESEMIKRSASFSKLPGFKEDQKLTSFIDDRVRPRPEEMSSLNGAVDTVVRYLHEFNNAVPGQNYKVKKVVKSGSLGKGTAVQNKMDIDLVVFLQKFTSMRDFLQELPEILRHLEAYARKNAKLRVDSANRFMVKCTLSHKGKDHSVDILPAVDLVDLENGIQTVHREMDELQKARKCSILEHYSVCFAEYQKQFVKDKADPNSKLKDLIRLVKYWSKENGLGKIAVSYCLELVSINVYEDYATKKRFKMSDLFEKVMQKLIGIETLQISFDKYYSSSKYRSSWSLPFVMDPANPFQNTLPQDKADRKRVVQTALKTLKIFPEADSCTVV